MGVLVKSIFVVMIAICFLSQANAQSKKRSVRKVQEVNFGEMNLKGTIRNPDGAYLVQKKGIKFMPLYDVQKDMDSRIRESALYLNN